SLQRPAARGRFSGPGHARTLSRRGRDPAGPARLAPRSAPGRRFLIPSAVAGIARTAVTPLVAPELADGLLARGEGSLPTLPRLEVPSTVVVKIEPVQGVATRPAARTAGGVFHAGSPPGCS